MATIIQYNKYVGGNLHDKVFGHSKWLRFVGFVLLCLGVTTIIVPLMPTLHSTAVLAGLLATSGAMYIAHAVTFWWRRWLGFSLHMLAGIIYLTVGYIFFIFPLANIQILAEIMMASYLIVGLFRIMTAMTQKADNFGWGWTMLCGVVNIVLAFFILTQLPTINTGLIGLVVGIELLFTGWALFILGVNARREKAAISS